MDDFIAQCADYIAYDQYSVVSIDNIGQVVMRGDGYYGLLITNNPTSADNTPYQSLHVKYATCIPLVLYMTQYDSSTFTEDIIRRLTVNFLVDNALTFDDFYLPNQSYFNDLTLIWINSAIDHVSQVYDTTSGIIIIYRSEYSFYINPWLQNPNVH